MAPSTFLAQESEILTPPEKTPFKTIQNDLIFPSDGSTESFGNDPLIQWDLEKPYPGKKVPQGTFRRDEFDFIITGGAKFTDPPPSTASPRSSEENGEGNPAGPVNNQLADLAVRSAMSGDDPGLEEAYKGFRKADRSDPLFFPFVYNAGRTAYLKGSYKESEDYFRRSAELIPQCSICYLNLGRSLLQNGDKIGGRSALKEAIRINPFDSDPLTELGLDRLSENDLYRAAIYFEEALRINPGSPDATLGKVRILLQKGNLHEARGLLDEMGERVDTPQKTDYRRAQALFYRAIILEKMGQYGLAARRYESILEIASTSFFLAHPSDEIRRMLNRAKRLQQIKGIYDDPVNF